MFEIKPKRDKEVEVLLNEYEKEYAPSSRPEGQIKH